MNDISSIFSDVSWLMKEMLAMNISGYIGEIYIPGLRNVMTYHLWQLNINLLSICRQLLITIQDYQWMTGDGLVFIKNVVLMIKCMEFTGYWTN